MNTGQGDQYRIDVFFREQKIDIKCCRKFDKKVREGGITLIKYVFTFSLNFKINPNVQ
jgi:hypothetical protein